MGSYCELHCHSNYSFYEGASYIEELLLRAKDLSYPALALTDHDNLCGALEFAQIATSLNIKPITGAEITLEDGSHLTLIVRTGKGYSNLCRLITHACSKDSRNPFLELSHLSRYSEGIVLLTGCKRGKVPSLVSGFRMEEASECLSQYMDWFGSDNVFIELQQNLVYGDSTRNKGLVELATQLGVGVVATNNVHYHIPQRYRLQDTLVAIRHGKSLENTHLERRPNFQFYMKSGQEMASIFNDIPEAIQNSLRIAEMCSFDLTKNLGYEFPHHDVPNGYTTHTYLEKICNDAAIRKYGFMSPRVRERLNKELGLIRKHNLSGFLLIYHEIIHMAYQIMIELGLTNRNIPLEDRPPGRGRGSSVAMLVGYLIGISHIDPLHFNLSLERFLNEDMGVVPDIDLDFPRNIREELIRRIHERWGWDSAVLTGVIGTYKVRGAIRDIGKALGIPYEDLGNLAKRMDIGDAKDLGKSMAALADFKSKVDAPLWRDLIDLSAQIDGFPKYLAQHPGGMIISSSPLTSMVPVQPGSIEGRYICHWDKDSIQDAGFVKIDFLSLGTLSQMQDALQLIEERTGKYEDLSRIDFDDQEVYAAIQRADTIGVFQIESAAQMQTLVRIKPKNLIDMAFEVAAVRPGVGLKGGVSKFIERYSYKVTWDYYHPVERRALERTCGVILFQDQVNQLAMDVAGFNSKEADNLRRAFGRRNKSSLLEWYWKKFRDGALLRGIPNSVSRKIFARFSGQYMFPESHAYAFGITAYQMAWIKVHYPLEFFVAIFNQQPMGFYSPETLKEDAKRRGIKVLNPNINVSLGKCIIQDESILLGLLNVKHMGKSNSYEVVRARDSDGPFRSLEDLMRRVKLGKEELESLVVSGAVDSLITNRMTAIWEIGLIYRPNNVQKTLPISVNQDILCLPDLTDYQVMESEYYSMGIHPSGHFMAYVRPHLSRDVVNSKHIWNLTDKSYVKTVGLVIRRQRPSNNAIFITLEDEFGHIPVVVWADLFNKYRSVIKEQVLEVWGRISLRDGTTNIVASHIQPFKNIRNLPRSKDWQ